MIGKDNQHLLKIYDALGVQKDFLEKEINHQNKLSEIDKEIVTIDVQLMNTMSVEKLSNAMNNLKIICDKNEKDFIITNCTTETFLTIKNELPKANLIRSKAAVQKNLAAKKSHAPRVGEYIVRLAASRSASEAILGDLQEDYNHDIKRYKKWFAQTMYIKACCACLYENTISWLLKQFSTIRKLL